MSEIKLDRKSEEYNEKSDAW